MKFGFIAKHRGIWPVAWLCEAPLPEAYDLTNAVDES